jgi:hypothetical protein
MARLTRADLTIMDLDPLVVGSSSPQDLLHGRIVMTIVNGHVAFRASGRR